MRRQPSLWRDARGVSAVEYALLLFAMVVMVGGGYRLLGKSVKAQVECAASFDGPCAGSSGNGRGAGDDLGGSGRGGALAHGGVQTWAPSGSAEGAPPGSPAGDLLGDPPGHAGMPSDSFPSVSVTPPTPMTHPGEGAYYKNDTPIDTPNQLKEDYRPRDSSFWEKAGVLVAGPFSSEYRAKVELEVARVWLETKGYTTGADLLAHWLHGNGEAMRISPVSMMSDLSASFGKEVGNQVRDGFAKGPTFDTGWKSGSVGDSHSDANGTLVGDAKVADWYYALNGYQYRIHSDGSTVTKDGVTYKRVTVDVFKRYNFGNPNGGEPRKPLDGKIEKIDQNDIANLNNDGFAHDYNVWGRSTMLVHPNGEMIVETR